MTMTSRPAESGHWYTRDGRPAYTVVGNNGKKRDTTLRDARKLLLVPSVTGIIQMAARPGLEHWKQEQIMLAALTLPRCEDETEGLWIQRVWADSREQARKASERGTAIHAAIQAHWDGEPPQEEFWPYVNGSVEAVKRLSETGWIAEQSFANDRGYGGKVDLILERGHGWIIDIKTKEFSENDEIKQYDEHFMQLAAYRFGLWNRLLIDQAPCANMFVSTTNPGLVRFLIAPPEDLKRGLRMFLALLDYWKAKTGYDSGWDYGDDV